jgi:hypothetical protein
MSEILNFKFFLFSIIYASFGAIALAVQSTSDYMAALPNTTLAGIGLALAMAGGVLSYFWEKSKRKNASLRTNIVFALGAGVVIGLISYDRLVVQYGMVNFWLALLIASGFSNQMCLGVMSLVLRRRLADFWRIKDKEIDDNENSHDLDAAS